VDIVAVVVDDLDRDPPARLDGKHVRTAWPRNTTALPRNVLY
jgi:hypothetical protein